MQDDDWSASPLTSMPIEDRCTTGGQRRNRSPTEAQTGYCEETLDELWSGARQHFSVVFRGGAFQQRQRDTWRPKHYFFVFLMYIHLYPAKDNCVDALRTQKLAAVTYSLLFKVIVPLARRWAITVSTCDSPFKSLCDASNNY